MKKIKLTNGYETIIDDEDFKEVSKYKWYANNCNGRIYASTSLGKRNAIIRLHRFLMNPSMGRVVDHINGNSLDNRRKNLRVCSQSTNIANGKVHKDNPTGYKNICLSTTRTKRFLVRFRRNQKNIWLGGYMTIEEAIKTRDKFLLENPQ